MNISLTLYLTQQTINHFLRNNISHLTVTSIIITFIGGLLTSISPCMLSALPISAAYINKKKNKLSNGLLFIAGVITSITIIGISSLAIRKSYMIFNNITDIITPIIIIIIGFSLLNLIDLGIYLPFKLKYTNNILESYILGISIGLNISPCTTPILMTLIVWITNTRQIFTGFIFLLTYNIGYIIPIVISMFFINSINKIHWVPSLWNNIVPLSGSIVIATGAFSLFNKLFSIQII